MLNLSWLCNTDLHTQKHSNGFKADKPNLKKTWKEKERKKISLHWLQPNTHLKHRGTRPSGPCKPISLPATCHYTYATIWTEGRLQNKWGERAKGGRWHRLDVYLHQTFASLRVMWKFTLCDTPVVKRGRPPLWIEAGVREAEVHEMLLCVCSNL